MKKYRMYIVAFVGILIGIWCICSENFGAEEENTESVSTETESETEVEIVVEREKKVGDNVWYRVYSDGRLVYSGTGPTFSDRRWRDLSPYSDQDVHTIIIEEGITEIGREAFYQDTYPKLTGIYLPATLTKVDKYGFSSMSTRQSFAVYHPDLEAWLNIKFMDSGANPLENKADLYIAGEKLVYAEVPENITKIGDYAFMGCTSIQTVVMSKNVKSIGKFAFNTCPNLKEIYFTGDAPTFGENAFILTNVTIYYPENNPTWTDAVKRSVVIPAGFNGSVTWVPYEVEVEESESESEVIVPTPSESEKEEVVPQPSESESEIIETESEVTESEETEETEDSVETESQVTESEVTESEETQIIETGSQAQNTEDKNKEDEKSSNKNQIIIPIVIILAVGMGAAVAVLAYKKKMEI